MKQIEDMIKDLENRRSKALVAHREERNSERPDIRRKEAAWGKLVAYGVSLKYIRETIKLLSEPPKNIFH